MKLALWALVFLLAPLCGATPNPVARPAYGLDFLLSYTLQAKKISENPQISKPEIKFASQVSVKEFQDDIEPQWGLRPDEVLNAYVVAKNRIYILDDQAYYDRHSRCIDDSIVHELTHFVQSRYQGFDLHDESLEWDAIGIQSEFRSQYCKLVQASSSKF